MSEFVLTLVQMDCLFGDPAGNFERAEAFIADAAGRGSDLVVLPEVWHSSIDLKNAEAYASPVAAEAGSDGWFGRFADAGEGQPCLADRVDAGEPGGPVLQYYGPLQPRGQAGGHVQEDPPFSIDE